MQADYIIVGQGLSGTWLSYYLIQAGAKAFIVDAGTGQSASNAASGIINPITGKRLARQWMGETILPFAKRAYEILGLELDINLATETSIHTFFSNAEEAQFFEQKATAMDDELLHYQSSVADTAHFNFHYGIGTIHPALLIDVRGLLYSWRLSMIKSGRLLEEDFDWAACTIDGKGIRYKDIGAKAVIDCSGAAAAANPYFSKLPFALNKGEAIIAAIPNLPRSAIYKYAQLSVVPWDAGRFWIGSTYDWDFIDVLPTAAFRQRVNTTLRQWLRLPYMLHEHFAAIRPATVTRDAFAGLHPHYPRVGILNGMGSKGCSLAPFLSHSLAQHLVNGEPLVPQADVRRYARVLGR